MSSGGYRSKPLGLDVIAPGEVRGRELRYLLTTLLREAGRPLTVAELVGLCEAEGIVFTSRASKVVSDALRWEIGWRRVVRLRRGVYRYGRAPRSTRYWIHRRVMFIRDYLAGLGGTGHLWTETPGPGVSSGVGGWWLPPPPVGAGP